MHAHRWLCIPSSDNWCTSWSDPSPFCQPRTELPVLPLRSCRLYDTVEKHSVLTDELMQQPWMLVCNMHIRKYNSKYDFYSHPALAALHREWLCSCMREKISWYCNRGSDIIWLTACIANKQCDQYCWNSPADDSHYLPQKAYFSRQNIIYFVAVSWAPRLPFL